MSICTGVLIKSSNAQSYQWAKNIGGGGIDQGNSIYADNNGFVYVVGYFEGTNIDFDPSPSTSTLLSSSVGSRDGFVAKYTVAGNFVWAFKIGGSGIDVTSSVSVDAGGNVYVTGFFRGNNVDFDPSASTAFLSSNGDNGGDPGYGGDIFIAKYNSNGQYQWAFNVGSTSLGDSGQAIAVDASGNVYVAGYFSGLADFDPSAAIQNLDNANGTIFLAKYNTNGLYQWAFNVGPGYTDSSPFGLRLDASSNVYFTGFFQGSNIDFNPSPSAVNNLSSNGGFDIFVAKYNSSGQYLWAFKIGGAGADVGRDVEVDSNGDVYVVGDFNGTNIDFDPSTATANLNSAGAADVFLAKYNAAGQYQWAKRYGSAGSDISWGLTYSMNAIYITGSFQNTINFSPSGTDNLTSNGGDDIYLTKFDLNGNYICSFAMGGSGNDGGYKIDANSSGNLFVTGGLSSANVDFNPSSSVTNNLSTNGNSDIFFANYTWADNPSSTGTLSANSIICGTSGQGQLTFTATSGTGPFTIQYSNGTTTYTQNNVQSGVPFNLVPNPTSTTTYTLVSIRGSERCAAVNYPTGIAAILVATIAGIADFSFTQNICNPKTIQFSNSSQGATSFTWDFGNSTTNIGNANPIVTYAAYGTYAVKLKVQNSAGCIDSVTKNILINVLPDNNIISTTNTSICSGSSLSVNITDTGLTHCWSPVTGISNINSATPTITPVATTTYYYTSQTLGSNLVVNGDFSAGNTGFQSDYTLANPNTAAAQYWVGNSSSSWLTGSGNCKDHTTGTGNMLLVNGSTGIGEKVWKQTITVTPNTNYAFSTWLQSIYFQSPANLKFSINNNIIGNNINATSTECQWNKFYATWNSGSNTSAVITIINNNSAFSGNDFALDDISFSPVIMKQDSILITLQNLPSINAGSDAFKCSGDSVLLNATGVGAFSWTPITGLSNPSINNPKAAPSITTDYIVTLTDANGCAAKDTVRVNIIASGISADFSYTQDVCNPKTIQFSNSSVGLSSYSWNFGNSTTNNSSVNPTVTYSNYGTYTVKFKAQNAGGCIDSITKNIPINVQQDNNLITNNDLSVCTGSGTVLNIADTGLNHCWSPVTGISNINSATPTITPAATTTYYFTSQSVGTNLVVNGDFSAGNSGFTSDYISAFPNTQEGQYWIGNNVPAWNGGMSPCSEHTTGTGQMLMVNASPTANAVIWSQVVTVTPNTNYAFSTWIQSLHIENPASLKFSINGNVLGNNIAASSSTCQWKKFFATWNSGANTSITINIVNNNTIAAGNDFAIDDIFFGPIMMKQDSIKISVLPNPIVAATASSNNICLSDSSNLNASGAATYTWFPVNGLSNPNIANPNASPSANTSYTVTGYDLFGCSGTNTVAISIKPKPVITKTANANICKDSTLQISASAPTAVAYNWLPITGLNNPAIYNPLATPTATTNYIVTVDGSNGCSNKDSVLVTVVTKPTVQIRIDTSVCNKVPVTLTTISSNATSFGWLPVTGLSNAAIANPIATPSISTQYIVSAMNGTCVTKDTINLGILPLPTVVKTLDTVICKTGAANLIVSGGTTYSWFPSYAINNTSGSNIIATPDTTVKYFVTVTGSNACSITDSIKVTVNPKPVFAISPNSASICKGDTLLVTASGGDLYAWVPNTNISSPTSAMAKVYPPITTLYKVGITNTACKVTDTVSSLISLNGSLATTITKTNDVDCSHGQSTLHAFGGVNYLWDAALGISNLTSANPVVSPTQTTTYYVKITDAKGCSSYDSIKVLVDYTVGASTYSVPSAFSPDGNGINDCFGLKLWGAVTQLDFSVYSRWGQILFHTNNVNDCWDGKFNGQPQDSGTYVYQIKARTACGGDVFRKGTIVLIR